jgi:hypothetical protein
MLIDFELIRAAVGRPIAGHLNINPSRLDDNRQSIIIIIVIIHYHYHHYHAFINIIFINSDVNYGTVLHEMFHVLGFNSAAFYNFAAADTGIDALVEGPVSNGFGKQVYI